MSNDDINQVLTDKIKASVIDSGVITSLKDVTNDEVHRANVESLDELTQQAQSIIDNIQQLLDSNKLDDNASQKLSTILTRLKSALGKDKGSRSALAGALSEALSAMSSSTDGASKNISQLATEKLWQRVEADNKDIDDDFEKMRKAGIVFNERLLNKHKQLMEDLQANPHDLKTQKELDAVDDAMLLQAKKQIAAHPDVKSAFDDAKNKSEDRHHAVDQSLAVLAKGAAIGDADFDDDTHPSKQRRNAKLTLNDVQSQNVGSKTTNAGKSQII